MWTGVALSAASAIAGGIVGLVALSARGDVDARLADPVGRLETAQLEGKRAEIADLALTADILFAGAALFAVTTLALSFFTDFGGADDDRAQAVVHAAPWFDATSVGGSVAGRF